MANVFSAAPRAAGQWARRIPSKLANNWPIVIVLVLASVLYGHGLHNGFVDDDLAQIVDNTHLGSYVNDIRQVYTTTYHRPLMFMLFTTIYHVFGRASFWYHLSHLLIFLGMLVLVYLLFNRFVGRRMATALCLIVAVHPINVDAVAYVSHVQDPMFMVFGLLGWLVLDRWRGRSPWALAAWLAVLMLLAVASKETGLLWIPILALYTVLFKRSLFKPVVLGGLIGAGLYGLYVWLAPSAIVAPYHIVLTLQNVSLPGRLLNAPAIVWFYLRTFLWPASLNMAYEWTVGSASSPYFWGTLLVDIFFVGLAIVGGRFVKRHRPDSYRQYVFFLIWFALSMVTLLQIYPLDVMVAERWFLLPMVGLLGVAGIVASCISWKRLPMVAQSLLTAVAIIVVPAMFVRSYVRIGNFVDNLTLIRHDAQAHETSFRVYGELADALEHNGQYTEATYYYGQSLALRPKDNSAWSGLGNLAVDTNDLVNAERYYKYSLQSDPEFYDGYYNLGILYLAENRPLDAEQVLKQAQVRWPTDPLLKQRIAEAEQDIAAAENASKPSAATKK